MKIIRALLPTMVIIFLITVPSFAITYELIGFGDSASYGIVGERDDWAEVAEVEDVVSDSRITAFNYYIYEVPGPPPPGWYSGLWIWGAPGYVQTAFTAPSDSLFVQFHSDSNDGPADFYIDGVKVLSLNTNHANVAEGWFAVVFRDLPWSTHTLKVVATSYIYPHDLDIDAMGSGEPAVPVDIKPGSCPNPLNLNSKGVLPVAILGTEDFDVATIDPASVELEGVPPLRWSIEDVATPFNGVFNDDCLDCTTEGPDGYADLTLKFATQEIVGALGDVEDGQCIVLTLTGNLMDDTLFTGIDVVLIINKAKEE